MPQIGFICPDGKTIRHEDCLEKPCRLEKQMTMGRCKALPLLRRLAQVRTWKGIPSTTQCISGTMEQFLKITTDYYIDPESAIFRLLGTLTHGLLERYATGSEELSEEVLSDMINTGVMDFFDGKSLTLFDYKNSGSYKIAQAMGLRQVDVPKLDDRGCIVVYKSGAKKGQPVTNKEWREGGIAALATYDWALQMSRYRDLLAPKLPDGITIKRMAIQIIARDGGTYIAKQRGVTIKAPIIPINGMSTRWVTRYFTKKAENLLKAVSEGKWSTHCKPRERWENDKKCREFCEVKLHCPYYKRLTQGSQQDTEEVAA